MRKIILLVILGLFGLSTMAYAQIGDRTIKQRILMPGQVIQGHAEFEADCNQCHVRFDKSALTNQCIDCHDDIRDDRNKGEGFHGKSPIASTKTCNTCHTDHIGRDGDIINFHIEGFDHKHTNFELEGAHTQLACASCHEPGASYRDPEPVCVSCHKEDDYHQGALGTQCETCHQPQSWQQRLEFDHSTTSFPLQGLHKEVACSSCHAGQVYEIEETACVSCHQAADVHGGKNGQQCETCHSVDGWDKRIFDHSTTNFPLLNKHSEVPCRACHTDGVVEEGMPMACHDCHSNDDIHLGRNGTMCESCHTTAEWGKVRFDHAQETQFPLTGHHQELACTQCHSGALQDPLPRDCASCHAADDIHKTPEMQVCATCHVTDSWQTISRFDHDFTNFPLVGMHQIVNCQSCHVGNQFAGTESACVDCHRQDDYHKGALGSECSSCHTPNSWDLWQFDHKAFTGYELQGVHEGLSCASCHTPGSKPGSTSTTCGTCHQRQDIHKGGFGSNCGRCHSQDSFFELILQD